MVDAIEWECALCGCHIQNHWARRAMNLQIQFRVKLEHFSTEIIWVTQKATAMGNWWVAAASWPHAHSCIMSCTVFWWNIKSPRWLSPLTAQIWYPENLVPFWLLPKLKSPWKGKRFQTVDEIQQNTTGQLMMIERIVWGPKVATRCLFWRGLRHRCPMYNVSFFF